MKKNSFRNKKSQKRNLSRKRIKKKKSRKISKKGRKTYKKQKMRKKQNRKIKQEGGSGTSQSEESPVRTTLMASYCAKLMPAVLDFPYRAAAA